MVYWDWLPSALSDNIDLLQFSAQTPFQLLKPLIVNARASLFNIECKIQALNLADSTRNRLKQFETKVGAATSAGLESLQLENRVAEFPFCLKPGNGANIGFGPAEKQFW